MNQRIAQRGRLLEWMHGAGGTPWGSRPSDYDPEAVASSLHSLRHLFGPRRYFRVDAQGMEQIPDTPVMVVSNHSGGTSIPDAWGMMFAWYGHFGVDRPLHPMAHEMVFSNSVTGPYFARRGALQANRDLADEVLRDWGHDLLVMPGGDLDTWRPYRDRYRVRFSGRTGYARMAIRTGASIVPVAHAGAHETLIVLTDGRWLAHKLHLPELARANIFPVHLSFPLGFTVGPTPHIPPPVRLRYRFGAPIAPPVVVQPGVEPPAAAVSALDAQVQKAIQDLLDDLAAERAVWAERVRDRLTAKGKRVARRVRRRFAVGFSPLKGIGPPAP